MINDIPYRAANRVLVPLTLIGNQMLRVPPSPWIHTLQVQSGFDVADRRITWGGAGNHEHCNMAAPVNVRKHPLNRSPFSRKLAARRPL